MRAISLWQPWASAIALGYKQVETRHWSTDYRGPLAIHAAKRWTRDERDFVADERAAGRLSGDIPLGAIVAVCNLTDVRSAAWIAPTLSALELSYGNYETGRFAWMLSDIVELSRPVPFAGKQGFFSVPDGLLPPDTGVWALR